jgi:ABC-2 type transport system permease protein
MNPRPLVWSVRREVWENRSIYIAPLAVAAVIIIGALVKTLVELSTGTATLDRTPAKLAQPYNFAAVAIMAATFIVAFFYCIDALYGERRDRSILFWKSMPVSDVTTVLSKAAIPLVILPLVTFAVTIVTQLVMLLLSTAFVTMSGHSATDLWTKLPWLEMSGMLLYHLITVHSLYYAPIFGWLLLISAWARRAPFLWAAVPPVVISVLERMLFNTSSFASMLGSRVSGGGQMEGAPGGVLMLGHFHPGQFLSEPGLWIGLAFCAAFLAGAVRLRRYRDPI